jgi:hypothetical protein
VPVVPMALSGLWGSFFSRSTNGKAMRSLRGVYSRIAFIVAAPANETSRASESSDGERMQDARRRVVRFRWRR